MHSRHKGGHARSLARSLAHHVRLEHRRKVRVLAAVELSQQLLHGAQARRLEQQSTSAPHAPPPQGDTRHARRVVCVTGKGWRVCVPGPREPAPGPGVPPHSRRHSEAADLRNVSFRLRNLSLELRNVSLPRSIRTGSLGPAPPPPATPAPL